jgi:hypothetical protein
VLAYINKLKTTPKHHVLPDSYQSIGRPLANTSTMYQKHKAGQILES